ncbi:MAG: hypothetical protein ACEPO8_13570 [Rhodothermaceae bacterium]
MTDEEKIKWFDAAMRFGLDGTIHLVMKSKINGEANWSIIDTEKNVVLNSNMEWEEEPDSSQRDESFMIRARFNFDSALAIWQQYKMFAE